MLEIFGSKVAENNINKEMQLWSQTKIKHTLNLKSNFGLAAASLVVVNGVASLDI